MANDERLKKLTPELHNERYLFYWDFNASAGYDKDEFSRPDFVYVANEHVNVQTYSADEINDTNELPESIFEITNLPAFIFTICRSTHHWLGAIDQSSECIDIFVTLRCHVWARK